MRAVAAMSVLVFHAAIAALIWKLGNGSVNGEGTPHQFEPLFGFSAPVFVNLRAGIYIFFALSGYLLSRPFLAAYLVGSPVPALGRYLRNRALRIVPAFWAVTALYFIWDRLHTSAGALGLLADLGFAQNYYPATAGGVIGQAWTLDIEVAFYVLIPIVALCAMAVRRRWPNTPGRRLALTLAVLLCAYAASLYVKHLTGSPAGLTYNLADYLFAFVPGVALAAIEPLAAPRLRASPSGATWAWATVAACAALLGAFIAVPVRDVGLRLLLVTLGCGALVGAPLVWQWATDGCWRLLDNRAMHWLGERSYGIYLIHLGLMTHVLARFGHGHGLGTTFLLLLVGVTAATLVGADLLWRLVEQPALQRRLPWRQAEFGQARGRGDAVVPTRGTTPPEAL